MFAPSLQKITKSQNHSNTMPCHMFEVKQDRVLFFSDKYAVFVHVMLQ